MAQRVLVNDGIFGANPPLLPGAKHFGMTFALSGNIPQSLVDVRGNRETKLKTRLMKYGQNWAAVAFVGQALPALCRFFLCQNPPDAYH